VNFVGYVPLRRGLLSHIQEGRLTNNEALTFVVLLMLADKENGSGTINSPALRSFMPGLSHDAAKRALLGLEEKRYIFRQIIPFSKRVYRFWVNLYVPTSGPNKLRQINLSEVFESKDIAGIRYVDPAPEGAPQTAPQTPPQGAHHYKKDKDKEKKNTPLYKEACASMSDAVSDSLNATQPRIAKRTLGEACALQGATHDVHHGAPHCAPHCAPHDMHHDTTHTMHHDTTQAVHPVLPEDVGLKWSGYDGAYIEIDSGRVLSFDESERRLRRKI
jgi:hypothetical protein